MFRSACACQRASTPTINVDVLRSLALVAALGVAIAPGASHAAVIGYLGNFDVINDTGSTAHGFEIDLEGIHSSDITDTFGGPGRGFPTGRGFDPATSVQRYGAPTIAEYSNGLIFGSKVTYQGLFDGTSWDFGTPSGTFITPGDNCWSGGGVGYSAATPCDHFGVGAIKNASKTTYSWLLETATPGTLSNGTVNLPAPVWVVVPAPVVGAPPVVAAQIQAPAPENNVEFGEALWVKVFTTEIDRPVGLEELIGGEGVINEVENHTEVEWALMQMDLGNNGGRGEMHNGGNGAGNNADAVIRRYEFYRYAGVYDPESHEAKFIKDAIFGDSNPNPSDVGNYLGAQNGAVNLNGPPPAIVPLPGAAFMFASALFGLGLLRRRRA